MPTTMRSLKTCPRCQTSKNLSEFYNNRPQGSSYCKKCVIVYSRETYDPQRKKAYRENFKDRINAIKRERYRKLKKQNMEWLLQYLGTTTIHCDKCKYDKSFDVIQFHHLEKSQKEKHNDSLAMWLNQYTLTKFQEKILNTSFLFLCANCHIELHAGVWEYE